MQKTLYYELHKATKNKIVFRQRTKKDGGNIGDSTAEALRGGEIGYLYLNKPFWLEFQQPHVLKVVISADTEIEDPFKD